MKIKWIGNDRYLPKIGVLKNGDVRAIADQDARDLIRQGLAIEYLEPKKILKTKKSKE